MQGQNVNNHLNKRQQISQGRLKKGIPQKLVT